MMDLNWINRANTVGLRGLLRNEKHDLSKFCHSQRVVVSTDAKLLWTLK